LRPYQRVPFFRTKANPGTQVRDASQPALMRFCAQQQLLAQAVQRRDFERLFLFALVIAAAARGLDPSALFITPLFERAPSTQHPKLPRLCMAQFGNLVG